MNFSKRKQKFYSKRKYKSFDKFYYVYLVTSKHFMVKVVSRDPNIGEVGLIKYIGPF